jgi:hypothetical protein
MKGLEQIGVGSGNREGTDKRIVAIWPAQHPTIVQARQWSHSPQ